MTNSAFARNFTDPAFIERYLRDGPAAFAPGHAGLLQMVYVLLAETMPEDGRVLVVGAGGGLETRALAERAPGWRFTGVDPSPQMLALAGVVAGPAAGDRLELVEGEVAAAPAGPFDAATCLCVLGVLPDDGAKLGLLQGAHGRLKPGAPFLLVDQCLDRAAPDFDLRLDRYAAYARASGVDAEVVAGARATMAASTTVVSRARDEALLTEAGFRDAEVFYVGFAWTGWIAYA